MGNQKIAVVARISARPGKESEVRDELQKLVLETRREAGCLVYDLHLSKSNPREFLFYEQWRSQADLELHFQTPHIKNLQTRADELLASPTEITIWESI